MLLTVENITKDFGGLRALEEVSIKLEEGKITALIGPNGAGKTTLFNIIVGVYPPTEGSIFFKDKRIDGMPTHKIVEQGIARTFQLPKLFKNLTVIENVMAGRHIKTPESTFLPVVLNLPSVRRNEIETYEYSMEMLKLAGIDDRARDLAGNLPHGQQRLLELARAMAIEPKLLLLDEPAAGLNVEEEDKLKESFQTIINNGTTILLVEHDMRMVMGVSQWINVLEVGKKIAEGTPEEIGRNPEVIKAYLGKEI